jgi:hypothetical protein
MPGFHAGLPISYTGRHRLFLAAMAGRSAELLDGSWAATDGREAPRTDLFGAVQRTAVYVFSGAYARLYALECERLCAGEHCGPTWRRGNREERCDALSRIRPYTLFDLPLVALAHRLPPELNCKHLSLNGWFEHIRPVGK